MALRRLELVGEKGLATADSGSGFGGGLAAVGSLVVASAAGVFTLSALATAGDFGLGRIGLVRRSSVGRFKTLHSEACGFAASCSWAAAGARTQPKTSPIASIDRVTRNDIYELLAGARVRAAPRQNRLSRYNRNKSHKLPA